MTRPAQQIRLETRSPQIAPICCGLVLCAATAAWAVDDAPPVSLLPPLPAASSLKPSPTIAAASASAAWQVDIEAAPELKTLLSRHLDLARLAQLKDNPKDDPGLDETEWRRLLAATPAQVRELLQTEGYFESRLSVQLESGDPVRVRLVVSAGPRIRVGQVAVVAEGTLALRVAAGEASASQTDAALRATGPLRSGDFFRNPLWGETKLQWLAALRAAGHAAASLRSSAATVDVAAGTARLEAVLDSGPLFRAGPLQIEGLTQHDERTAQRLADFAPGEPLTEALLLDFQDRLQKAGLFDAVSVSFDPRVDQADAAPVVVRLHELPLQQATAGIGVSTDTGVRATLEHTHRRPFGWALTATNKLEWGRQAQRWAGDFLTHPGEHFTRNLAGVLIERTRSDTDIVLSQRLRLGRSQDSPTLERLAFVEALRSRQQVIGGATSDAQALSANVHLVLRRLDNLLLPTRGYSLSLQSGVGQARSSDAPSGTYARLYGRLTTYVPLGNGWYGTARAEAGQIIKRDAVIVPDALGFRSGGDDSVRGYAYRSLAPTLGASVVSGSKLFTTSAEVAHTVVDSLPSVQGALFVDAGRAVNTWGSFKPAVGYGAGVRWRSPIGPVRADLAWGEEVRKVRLHLTVGVTF